MGKPAPLAVSRLSIVLRPDFTIEAASEDYLRATLVGPEEVAGIELFELFLDNPHEPAAAGSRNLRRSLHKVLEEGRRHRMALQRHDVRDRISGNEAWIEKYWLPVNTPVMGSGSQEIAYIIHEVQDVTVSVQLQRWIEEQALVIAEQQASLRRMAADLARRQAELDAARARLSPHVRGRGDPSALDVLRREVGAPDARPYFGPGARAPVTGIYQAFHHVQCEQVETRVLMREQWPFRQCQICGHRVLYRLLKPKLPIP